MADLISGLVSTIIPNFNRTEMLREAVESVLDQTWRPIEIIISDDGSMADSVEFARALQSRHPEIVHMLQNNKRGAGPAREAARLLARGEFIQYLDSDDRLLPRKFKVQVQALTDQTECGAAYGQIRLFDDEGVVFDKPHKWSGREIKTLFPALLVDRWWNTDAPLWRREVCDRIGPWSDLRYSQDWEYDARAGALGIQLAYCPEFVCEQRHHENSRQTGHGGWLSPADQVRFFSTLYECAVRAGVDQSTPEMQHFARWVFARSRQCGIDGDSNSARSLCRLALQAAGDANWSIKAYSLLASLLGWKATGLLSSLRDSAAGGRTGPKSMKQSWMTDD